jgi:hypothetical protein
VSKMRWDKVRDSDRVRDGRSDVEMAEDRDEEWHRRESEREAKLPQARYGRGRVSKQAPRKRPQKPARAMKKAVKKKVSAEAKAVARRESLARMLGLSAAVLRRAEANDERASAGLGGVSKKRKREFAARRLGITSKELGLVRSALNGTVENGQRTRVALLVETVASRTGWAEDPPVPKPSVAGKASKTKAAPAKASTKAGGKVGNDTTVFVTKWGNVVHPYANCHSTRGFRKAAEKDPAIYRVSAKDPSCRGRRVCGTCSNGDGRKAKSVDEVLRRLHGAAFDEQRWEKEGWSRPVPSGPVINPKGSR